MLIGFILDVMLARFYSMAKDNINSLNTASLWVYRHLAGDRFLPQELMAGFWLSMVLIFLIHLYFDKNPIHNRIGFLYSFLFLWGMVISTAGGFTLACIKPFDLLIAKPEGATGFAKGVEVILLGLVLAVIFLPIFQYLRQKAEMSESAEPLISPQTASPAQDVPPKE